MVCPDRGLVPQRGAGREQVWLRVVDGLDEGVSQKDTAQHVEGIDAVLYGRGIYIRVTGRSPRESQSY